MLCFLSKYRSITLGGSILLAITIIAIFAPLLASQNPRTGNMMNALISPNRTFPLGTDQYGRDILSRIIYGSRLSLLIGLLVQGLNTLIGVSLGLFAGYFGGKLDDFVMGLTNLMLSVPVLILSLAIMAILGPGLFNLFIALTIAGWTYTCRIARANTLSVKTLEYTQAARAMGCSTFRILSRHILPNILGPILVIATLGVADVILMAATLSFLGLGAQPPTPEWGAMLSQGRDYMYFAPWISMFPGMALFITIMGLNVLGDGLQDFLNPRQRRLKR